MNKWIHLLELSIQDYSQHVNDWLIESQWASLYGLNLDEQSLTRAFTTRSLDWETQYTYAYSKIVGLQAGGDWVLQKDYIDLIPITNKFMKSQQVESLMNYYGFLKF